MAQNPLQWITDAFLRGLQQQQNRLPESVDPRNVPTLTPPATRNGVPTVQRAGANTTPEEIIAGYFAQAYPHSQRFPFEPHTAAGGSGGRQYDREMWEEQAQQLPLDIATRAAIPWEMGADLATMHARGESSLPAAGQVFNEGVNAAVGNREYQYQGDAPLWQRLMVDFLANPADNAMDAARLAGMAHQALRAGAEAPHAIRNARDAYGNLRSNYRVAKIETLLDDLHANGIQDEDRMAEMIERLQGVSGYSELAREVMLDYPEIPPEIAEEFANLVGGIDFNDVSVDPTMDHSPWGPIAGVPEGWGPSRAPAASGIIATPMLRQLIDPDRANNFMPMAEDIRYMDPRQLIGAEGNALRRSPEEQAAFVEQLRTEGFQEPAILIYDPRTNRFKVGEGNHRAQAALAMGEMMPVRAWTGTVRPDEGMPLPRDLVPDQYGYVKSNMSPEELGFEVKSTGEILDYAALTGQFTEEELSQLATQLERVRWGRAKGPTEGEWSPGEAQGVFDEMAWQGEAVAADPPDYNIENALVAMQDPRTSASLQFASRLTKMRDEDLAGILVTEGPGGVIRLMEEANLLNGLAPLDPMVRQRMFLDLQSGLAHLGEPIGPHGHVFDADATVAAQREASAQQIIDEANAPTGDDITLWDRYVDMNVDTELRQEEMLTRLAEEEGTDVQSVIDRLNRVINQMDPDSLIPPVSAESAAPLFDSPEDIVEADQIAGVGSTAQSAAANERHAGIRQERAYQEISDTMPHLSEVEREALATHVQNQDAEMAHAFIDSLVQTNRLSGEEASFLRQLADDFSDPGSDASLDAARAMEGQDEIAQFRSEEATYPHPINPDTGFPIFPPDHPKSVMDGFRADKDYPPHVRYAIRKVRLHPDVLEATRREMRGEGPGPGFQSELALAQMANYIWQRMQGETWMDLRVALADANVPPNLIDEWVKAADDYINFDR